MLDIISNIIYYLIMVKGSCRKGVPETESVNKS